MAETTETLEVPPPPPPTYFRYRLIGGAYVGSSVRAFPQALYSGHGEVIDPAIEPNIDWDAGGVLWDGTQFRNGSPAEVLVMESAAAAEEILLDKQSSKGNMLSDRRIEAILKMVAEELNVIRAVTEGLAPVALGSMKERVNVLIDEG